jgi:hypothetical protein
MKIVISLSLSLLTISANASSWKGHLATLWDAQLACTNTDSAVCIPFLAEAGERLAALLGKR